MKRFPLILLTSFVYSQCVGQPYAQGGVSSIGVNIGGGYRYEKLSIEGAADANPYNTSTVPLVMHVSLGYDLWLLTPSIGISHIKVTVAKPDGYPELNYTRVYGSLSLGKDISIGERLFKPFLFITYSYQLYEGVGMRIYFK